ncbi:hypothetical protein ABZ567_28825 [Streptomyces sp. NPDC016459]|uniref:hypothetical protein n=1 Tax=Streptomyces sp. NPDC016459 TaxID=3157190 RepID=UPI0033EBA085
MTSAWSGGAGASNRSERIPRQTDLPDGVGKLQPATGVVFAVQILLRTEAGHPQLAPARMRRLIAALSMTSGENCLKVRPVRAPLRERVAAARVQDLLFGLQLGKAGHSKTEEALVQCIAMAHSGYGCWFLNPHGEGWARAKPYLAHPEIADRLWEINLAKADPDQAVVSWNPLSMEGRTLSDVQDIVRSVTEGIAAAQDWGDNAPRARTILARASQALALLNLQAVQAGAGGGCAGGRGVPARG